MGAVTLGNWMIDLVPDRTIWREGETARHHKPRWKVPCFLAFSFTWGKWATARLWLSQEQNPSIKETGLLVTWFTGTLSWSNMKTQFQYGPTLPGVVITNKGSALCMTTHVFKSNQISLWSPVYKQCHRGLHRCPYIGTYKHPEPSRKTWKSAPKKLKKILKWKKNKWRSNSVKPFSRDEELHSEEQTTA